MQGIDNSARGPILIVHVCLVLRVATVIPLGGPSMSRKSPAIGCASLCVLSLFASQALSLFPTAQASAPADNRGTTPIYNTAKATLQIHAAKCSQYPIPRYLTGKFCEHLGNNIYNGMDAQILLNPTMAALPFSTGQMSPDGIATFHFEEGQVTQQIRRKASRFGWPNDQLDNLARDYRDGLACFWTRLGEPAHVRVSPDTGPYGGRAQRIQVSAAGEGIGQWSCLPLHRVRQYQFELLVRSTDITALRVSLAGLGEGSSPATAVVSGLTKEWQTLTGVLRLGDDLPSNASYRFAVAAAKPGQFVIARAMLRPADHVNGADPDVIRLLKESRLPILRWPGGNFVSGYHWQDGIGPAERRPTKPNYAWGDLETNQFGTDEFIAFCLAVGCEPMICVNAGDGTPQEAAQWIQYCNGPADTPMGALRAANGHPEPYGVKYWEIGNELWGRWQYHWTTAEGYVDRFSRFAPAMRQADPGIRLLACGAPVFWGKTWNDTLIAGAASLQVTTDHPLIGGDVPAQTDPMDVYRDFMAVPDVLAEKWAGLEEDMKKAGIKDPRLAVTELQMFAHVGRLSDPNAPMRLTGDTLVSPATLAEALYDVLIYHRAMRLAPFVEMVTHSATVNHGGGLRKSRERVYANPCHYAQSLFADLAQSTPVGITLDSPKEQAPLVLPDLRNVTSSYTYATVDALAAVAADGRLWISLVHRGTRDTVSLEVSVHDFPTASQAEMQVLSAEVPWAQNTLENPLGVSPRTSTVGIEGGTIRIDIRPFSLVRLMLQASK